MTTAWPAPTAREPVDAVVRLPGSKSMTNRALLLAALADGPSTVRRPLRSRDTALMVAALRSLGAVIDEAADELRVRPIDSEFASDRAIAIDVGNAGTVLRFVPPAAAAVARSAVSFDGDPAVRRRPISELLAALRSLGASIDGQGVPFTVAGRGHVRGGRVTIDASSSSQLVSSLLLAGVAFDDGVAVEHVGARDVPNAPHIAMTIAMLRERAVTVDDSTAGTWRVSPGELSARDCLVEPDLSSAAPFVAAALVTAGVMRIRDWPEQTTQPGGRLIEIAQAFGGAVSRESGDLVVRGGDVIEGVNLDLRDAGELTPVIAAVAALASTPSRITGIDYLRGHETDRLAALARELSVLGAEVTELDDGLQIVPKAMHGNVFATYDDHRLAMAAAVMGLVVPDVILDDVATTAKTFPDFDEAWISMVAGQATP